MVLGVRFEKSIPVIILSKRQLEMRLRIYLQPKNEWLWLISHLFVTETILLGFLYLARVSSFWTLDAKLTFVFPVAEI